MEWYSQLDLLRDLLHAKKDDLCHRRRAPPRLPYATDLLCSAIVYADDSTAGETVTFCNAA